MVDPNYWVTDSITDDGTIVIVSDRDGGVIEGFSGPDAERNAQAEAARLNAQDNDQ